MEHRGNELRPNFVVRTETEFLVRPKTELLVRTRTDGYSIDELRPNSKSELRPNAIKISQSSFSQTYNNFQRMRV